MAQPGLSQAPLSQRLRAQTADIHLATENQLRLPQAIANGRDYRLWLARYFGLFAAFERELAAFPQWRDHGFPAPDAHRSERIAADLGSLGIDTTILPRPAVAALPPSPTFAHAVGMFYVLEGAELGGRVILRDLETRLGAEIAGATCFFAGGSGNRAGMTWPSVRNAIDGFGATAIDEHAAVDGARRTFAALLAWFAPICPRPAA